MPCSATKRSSCATKPRPSGLIRAADPAFLLEPDALSIDALKAEGVDFDRH
jgi:hypothetical protein